MIKVIEENDELEESFLKSILDYILQRTRFTYGYPEIVHYLTRCMCIRKHNSKLSEAHKKQVLYKKGTEKLERELDIVNLVRSIR
jgi:hypothetical protein